MTPQYKLIKLFGNNKVKCWTSEEPEKITYHDARDVFDPRFYEDQYKKDYSEWLSSAEEFEFAERQYGLICLHIINLGGNLKELPVNVTNFCEIRDGLAYFKPVDQEETQGDFESQIDLAKIIQHMFDSGKDWPEVL